MDALQTLVTTLPLSVTAGINVYATVLIVGLGIRLGWWQDAPEGLQVLAAWPVIIIAGVLYVVEFIVDKFQFLDNAWDLVHSFIRPPAAAVLAAAAVYGEADPVVTVVAALLAGCVAGLTHGAKAGARVLVNAVSPAESVSNVTLSTAEDIFAVGLAAVAMVNPWLAAAVAAAVVAMIVLVGPRLLRWGAFVFRAMLARVAALVRQRREADPVPPRHLALLGHPAPLWAVRCRPQKVPRAAGRSGYLVLLPDRLAFTCRKFLFWHRLWEVPLAQVRAAYFRRRLFSDVLAVDYRDARGKERAARFVFTRYRSPPAEEMGRRLRAQGLPGRPAAATAGAVSLPARA